MAKIIENSTNRRLIRLSTDDVISIVREYQSVVTEKYPRSYDTAREALDKKEFYLPEELF